jgi:hypothetical protein
MTSIDECCLAFCVEKGEVKLATSPTPPRGGAQVNQEQITLRNSI